jgi:flagellar protein FlaI
MEKIQLNLNPKIPSITKAEKSKTDVRYVVLSPYVSIHIFWNEKLGDLVYEIEEPVLSFGEKEILKRIEIAMQDMINLNVLVEKTEESLIEYIDKSIKVIISELNLEITEETYKKIFYYLYRNFVGLNEIEPLMRDYFIEDIECNGAGEPIYIVHRIFRNLRTNIKFEQIDNLANFVEKLAQKSGRYISYATPLLDGTLPDGSRVNATYTTDVTSKGPTFTIRKFTKTPWTPIQLLTLKTLSPEMLAYFWLLMQYKCNVLIAGGTGTGKTTLLNAIAFFIPPEARVVSIEDTRELNLPRENWLPSVARTSVTGTGTGEIDMFSLLKNSFRQNPDYVIVGEIRGKEAFVLFQGMASGHASISTMHADSVEAVIRRLETPPISLNPTLVNELDVVLVMSHAIVKSQDIRKLREVIEVANVRPDGIALTNTPFIWSPSDDKFYFKRNSQVFDKISKRYGMSKAELFREFEIRTKLIYNLFQKNIFDFDSVYKVVNDYYKNPQEVMKRFGII